MKRSETCLRCCIAALCLVNPIGTWQVYRCHICKLLFIFVSHSNNMALREHRLCKLPGCFRLAGAGVPALICSHCGLAEASKEEP